MLKKGAIRLQLLEKLEKQVNTATSRIIPTAPSLPASSNKQGSSRNTSTEEAEEEDPVDDNEDNEIVEEIHVEMKRKLDDDEEELVKEDGDKRNKVDGNDGSHGDMRGDGKPSGQTTQTGKQEPQ